MHWRLACLILCCFQAWTAAHIVFPVCSLDYLAENSTQIILGTVTPGISSDPHEPPFDHVTVTRVFKGTLRAGQEIEVPEVLADFPSHWTHWNSKPPTFPVDTVLLFLNEQNPFNSNVARPGTEYFQMIGGGPCFFSGDRAYACFQAMNPPPSRVIKERQNPLNDRWAPMPTNAPSNPPDLTRQQILRQLGAALRPTAERQAILSGDPDDPELVRARCEFIRQRRIMFADVEFLSDGAVQTASDRIGRIKPFEQLDALVMGPDVALGDAVPTAVYLASDIGRRRLVEHFADPALSTRRFDQLSMALSYGGVARGYLADHDPRPGDAPAGTQPYPFLSKLAELAARPDQGNSNRQILLDRLTHLRDDRQDNAIRIDPACMPDIAAAIKVLDDASKHPELPGNKWNEFKLAADHLRTFQGGFIPAKNS